MKLIVYLSNKVAGEWDATLRSYIATAQGIVESSILEIFPLHDDYNQGTGTYLDQPITKDGACWNSPLFDGGAPWNIGGPSLGYTSFIQPYLLSTRRWFLVCKFLRWFNRLSCYTIIWS